MNLCQKIPRGSIFIFYPRSLRLGGVCMDVVLLFFFSFSLFFFFFFTLVFSFGGKVILSFSSFNYLDHTKTLLYCLLIVVMLCSSLSITFHFGRIHTPSLEWQFKNPTVKQFQLDPNLYNGRSSLALSSSLISKLTGSDT